MRAEGQCMAGGPLSGRGVPVPLEPVTHRDPLAGHRYVPVPRSKPAYPVSTVVELPAPAEPYRPSQPDPEPPAAAAGERPAPSVVRAWAIRTGRRVGARGRVPESLFVAYQEETA